MWGYALKYEAALRENRQKTQKYSEQYKVHLRLRTFPKGSRKLHYPSILLSTVRC